MDVELSNEHGIKVWNLYETSSYLWDWFNHENLHVPDSSGCHLPGNLGTRSEWTYISKRFVGKSVLSEYLWFSGRQLIPKPWTSNGPKYSPFKGKEWQYPGSNNVFCQKEGEPIQCSPSSFVGWPTDFYTNWTMVGEVSNMFSWKDICDKYRDFWV